MRPHELVEDPVEHHLFVVPGPELAGGHAEQRPYVAPEALR